jgi:hypothetical protein
MPASTFRLGRKSTDCGSASFLPASFSSGIHLGPVFGLKAFLAHAKISGALIRLGDRAVSRRS